MEIKNSLQEYLSKVVEIRAMDLPVQERLNKEYNELNKKMSDIVEFLHSKEFKKLYPIDQVNLREQYRIMVTYRAILVKKLEK